MDDFLQAEEAEELDDDGEDVDNDGEEHTSHQDDGADQEGGEDRTRDAGDHDDARQEQGQAAEGFEHGAAMAKDALGAGGSDQAQGQKVGTGQHGLINRDSEVTVVGTQSQSGQSNSDTINFRQHTAANEPIIGKRNRVKTNTFLEQMKIDN